MYNWEAAWVHVTTFLPRFVAFLATLIIGFIVAKVLGNLTTKVAKRVNLDRKVERGNVRATLERSGYSVSQILGKLVYYTIGLFVLQLAFGYWGPNPISSLLERFIAFLPNIFVAIAIMVVAAMIASAIKELLQAFMGGLSYGKFVANAVSVGILAVAVFAALDQLAIAPAIVNGLFYAMLAIVAGSAIVAIGGGGIMPMRERWERALDRIDQEAPRLQAQVESMPTTVQHRAMEYPSNIEAENAGHARRDQEFTQI